MITLRPSLMSMYIHSLLNSKRSKKKKKNPDVKLKAF